MAESEGIDVNLLLNALAEAMLKAYKKRPDAAEDAEIEINPETGDIKVIGLALDTEGNVIDEWDATPEDFGRIAAREARNNLLNAIADIRRRQMYEEFANREGDIVSATILQMNERFALLDIAKAEALLPQTEQIAFEMDRSEIGGRSAEAPRPSRNEGEARKFRRGDRLKVYIIEVRETNRGPSIIVSRTHPALVAKLFDIEVPEIANGLVEIKAIAREPGHRSKVAVANNDPQVDPVGACVGSRGTRVRNITNELRAERVDIVPYSEDPIEFIAAALAPARIREIVLEEDNNDGYAPVARVYVHSSQLSLAIGTNGQNARLAGRLTGWDIRVEEEYSEEISDEELTGEVSAENVNEASELEMEEVEYGTDSVDETAAPDEEVAE
jgi:N utilization substance protein A